jgi:hypothetical protein
MAEASNSKLTLSFVIRATIVSVGLTIDVASALLGSGFDIVYKYITKNIYTMLSNLYII